MYEKASFSPHLAKGGPMATQSTIDFDTAMTVLSQKAASNLGTDAKLLGKLRQLEANHRTEGLEKPEISADLQLPVAQGYGAYTSASYTTFWQSFSGAATITAPNDGTTWSIIVTDIAQADQIIFQANDIAYNQSVQFNYHTGFTFQVRVEARCSNPTENTTLVIHLDTTS